MSRFKLIRWIRNRLSPPDIRRILSFLDHYVLGLIRRIDEHNLFFAGASIAYSLFLGIIPFILMVFSILGNIFEISALQNHIFRIIDNLVPYPIYADYIKRVIASRLPEVISYKNAAGFIGVIGLLFTSTWIFSSMRIILNQVYHTKIQKHLFIAVLRDIGMVILFFLIVTLTTFSFPAINLFLEATENLEYFQNPGIYAIWNTGVWAGALVVMLLLFFALYYLIPYEKLPKRVAFVSALWTTALWELARSVFGYYVRYFLGSSALYGAFVLIIVVMLWVLYSSCIFIIGAEIGQLYRERIIQRKKK